MPALADLDVVRRLNAPTRAAAAKRRRLRKAIAACLLASGILVLFGPRNGHTPPSEAATPATSRPDARLSGRQLVGVQVDPALRSALTDGSRVDLWSPSGRRLVRQAPVSLNRTASSRMSGLTPTGDPAGVNTVLVALTSDEIRSCANVFTQPGGSPGGVLVTLSP